MDANRVLWFFGLAIISFAVGWWFVPSEQQLQIRHWIASMTGSETASSNDPSGARRNSSEPRPQSKIYRWVDEKGVTQFSSSPPQGRPYQELTYRDDVNVVPALTDETSTASGAEGAR